MSRDGAAPQGLPSLPVAWVHRDPPLEPAAVTARGSAARVLAAVAAARLEDGEAVADAPSWRGAVSGDRLVLLGDGLPWCDGSRYLGWEEGVLLPTGVRPDVPSALVARRSRSEAAASVVAVLPDAVLALPAPGRPVDAATLRAWAAR